MVVIGNNHIRHRILLLIILPYLSLEYHGVCCFTAPCLMIASRRHFGVINVATRKNNQLHLSPSSTTRASTSDSSSSSSSGISGVTAVTDNSTTTNWTAEKLLQFARQKGVTISLTTLGPGFRVVGRATPPPPPQSATTTASSASDKNDKKTLQEQEDSSIFLGYVEGFVRGSILHLDKMQVFRSRVQLAHQTCPDFDRTGGSIFGVGLLLGYLALLHGRDQKCHMAEFLAIDDEDHQHRRLVRLYKRSGFNIIKYVGDSWQDIPDRLVWGGCGTLMSNEVQVLLNTWSRILQRAKRTTIAPALHIP